MVDHTIRTLYSKSIGRRPPDLKPLVVGAPRLVLGQIFDLDELIRSDDYKDSAEVSSEDYSLSLPHGRLIAEASKCIKYSHRRLRFAAMEMLRAYLKTL